MKRFVIALVAVGILAVPAVASAAPVASTASAPVIWAGNKVFGDYAAVESLVLKTSGGKVSVKSLQVVVSCTERIGGRVFPIAFYVYNSSVRDTLSFNRFVINLSAVRYGNRRASVRVKGTLGSNGRGPAQIRLRGLDGPDEECERNVTFQMYRADVAPVIPEP